MGLLVKSLLSRSPPRGSVGRTPKGPVGGRPPRDRGGRGGEGVVPETVSLIINKKTKKSNITENLKTKI